MSQHPVTGLYWIWDEHNREMDRHHREHLWFHGPHMLQQPPYLGQSSHSRAMEPYQTWPSGLQIQQLRSRLCPWEDSNNHRAKTKPHFTSCTDFKYPNTNYNPYQGDRGRYTGLSVHTKTSRHTQFAQVYSHIRTTLEVQRVLYVLCSLASVVSPWIIAHLTPMSMGFFWQEYLKFTVGNFLIDS